MANKSLTIGEVEKMRGELNTTIAEAIQKFESEAGMKVGYIDTIRKKDQEEKDGCCGHPVAYNSDRGEVVAVNVNMNMEF